VEATDVLDLVSALDSEEIYCWLDGGWGVDALLGEQTRPHGDLDLVVPRTELDRVKALLLSRGYEVIRDWLPTTLAFRDSSGREVDIHPIDTTPDGGGHQVLEDGTTWLYAPPVEGIIGGGRVRCASAEDQRLMHQGYEPRAVDHADVHRISQRFGLTPPPPFNAPGEVST
jgi:lincosamide nucleotidyltransferase A/C/D/E